MMYFNNRIKWVTILTIGYILLALVWWSILLYQKNKTLYNQQLRISLIYSHYDLPERDNYPTTEEITNRYQRQRTMIIGETLFILASVGVGIWLLMRGFLQEMQINRQRRNFLMSITHELKTPVASVQLALETLLKYDLDPDRKKKLIWSGLKETTRLNDTINKVLIAARIGQHYTPVLSQRDPKEMLKAWVNDFIHLWPTYPINLEMSDVITEKCTLDWDGLETIFRNLTENAAKYSSNTHPILVKCKADNRAFQLIVADRGPGIPDPEKIKVYDMFYRMGNEDQRTHKGSGLGLYIVREIVLRNNGKLQLQDNSPSGCVFSITFPIPHETHSHR